MKTRLIILAAVAAIAASVSSGQAFAGPKADQKAVVTCGNARFTVLTDRMIRMEWSEDACFEDRASLAIIERNLPVPEYCVERNGEGVTIKTDALTMEYKGGPFTKESLSVSFALGQWRPGDDPKGNLKGTTRTLDGCRGFERLSKV